MEIVWFLLVLLHGLLFVPGSCEILFYTFRVEAVPYTRLCSTKNILTVNGQFPGPTLYARRGDTLLVKVYNHASERITIHWHGVKQPRNPWSDGPEFITQCPIKPGDYFTYRIILSTEEGTIWWHAHNDFTRATVHGAIVVRPRYGTTYPFPQPSEEFVLILGEWWKADVNMLLEQALRTGGDINISDAYTINGQPGDLYPCSWRGTFRMRVEEGKRYLLRVVNAALSEGLFFAIADHPVVVVGSDGSYTKPLLSNYITISPGETMDMLLHTDRDPDQLYYIAARAFTNLPATNIDNTTATAVLEYASSSSGSPLFPHLPYYDDNAASTGFTFALRGHDDYHYADDVLEEIDRRLLVTVSLNELPCPRNSPCAGPNGTRFRTSLDNVSFVNPPVDILTAYYQGIRGVYGVYLLDGPPRYFNFTAEYPSPSLLAPALATKVRVLEYGTQVEVVFQGTTLLLADSHPMHLHGYSFYVVGWGLGNFDDEKDPLNYNLKDPPLKNTITVPRAGWVAIRFTADNPGVWFMHCHIERHMVWGMDTAFIVKDGVYPWEKMLHRPRWMPPCT